MEVRDDLSDLHPHPRCSRYSRISYSRPHRGARRQLKPGQRIHASVFDLKDYELKTRMKAPVHGEGVDSRQSDLLDREPDHYTSATEVVHKLRTTHVLSAADIGALAVLVSRSQYSISLYSASRDGDLCSRGTQSASIYF